MSRLQKFALLSCLYIAQGLPFGFFTQTLPVLLRDQGVELQLIGFSSVLVLPWAFKFLWAPMLDKWGARKVWILAANLAAVSAMVLLAFLPIERLTSDWLPILLGGFLLMNLFSATQDIAADGLAVSQLEKQERGLANGIQVAGYRVGMIIGGGLLLAWFSRLGWQYSLWLLAAILFLVTLPVLLFKEKPHQQEQESLSLSDFVAFFSRSNMLLWVVILVLFKLGDYLSSTMVKPMLLDVGFSLDDIALILGTVGFGAGMLGAIAGGALVNVFGRFQSLFWFALLQALTVGAWVLLPQGFTGTGWVYGLSALEHFVGGLATAALFTVMMDHCREQCAGSDYTVQACIVVLASISAAALSGVSAQALGYVRHFALSSLLAMSVLPCIIVYRERLPVAS